MTALDLFGGKIVCEDRLEALSRMDADKLRQVVQAHDVQLTVRARAAKLLAKVTMDASGFPALNREARSASRGHFVRQVLPGIRARQERVFHED
jgi:hypothetical protein